ncbi:helix-turn-helix domain-containing protein [Cryobacterium sp. GrIS_2_6]|uniref:helix-turn-helix domain-containing protein n=1 Tax=Cryobacterium sp. GrIS_2_6 TaxID=3162785 RepID=UPI0034DCD0A2
MRIESEFSQEVLADRANISRSAVQGLELGTGTRLHTLLAVLRALDRVDALDGLLPMEGPSPLEVLAAWKKAQKTRQRFRAKAV